jgi:hypothetical protein
MDSGSTAHHLRSAEMPLDSLEFTQTPLLTKLARVERLLATEQQWCKGRLRDSDGRHCLVGAIEAADGWKEIAPIVLRAVREVSGKRYWRIESFNDDPRTTHAEVLAVLRLARRKIIADMMTDDADEPWHRRWAQALRRLHSGPAPATTAAVSAELAAPHCSARPSLRVVVGEADKVF